MAEAERRPGKTPLLKQPEIEVEDEEKNKAEKGENQKNPDYSINDLHSGCCTDSSKAHGDAEHIDSIVVTNGDTKGEQNNKLPAAEPGPVTNTGSLPESQPTNRSLKMNHSMSSKNKPLQRSSAICEDSMPEIRVVPEVKVTTTPAPDDEDSLCEYSSQIPLLGQDTGKAKLMKNGSLSSDAGTSNCSLSRESSIEKNMYKDSSGCDLEEFLKKTLIKSKKDKTMLLNLERDFKIFVRSEDQHYQLAEMCSYDRMICHRVAAFYGMEHNIDKTGKCVIVSKTKFTRIPTFSCEEHVKSLELSDESGSERKMRLLKKPASMEERSQGREKEKLNQRTKSLEERQKTYDEKRAEIFGSKDDPNYPVIDPMTGGGCKHLSSLEWISTDSSGYVSEDSSRQRRQAITKANSYGGKPTIHLTPSLRTCSLSKADSIMSYDSNPVHTKQASPENSQSPVSRSSSADVSSPCHVQPHRNADGSLYRYDPSDPPPWLVQSSTPSNQPQHVHLHQPVSSNITYTPNSSLHQVQYTTSNDLCNRMSIMEMGPAMDSVMDGQPLLAYAHHPQQQAPPQPVPQPHPQQTTQMPLMVSTNMQPTQPFVAYTAGTTQTPGFYPQFQFVHMDYGPQIMPGLPAMQPMDQSSMGSFTQTVFPGPVTDNTGANGYCIPAYMHGGSVVYAGPPYPSNQGSSMMTPISATHYGSYNPPQSSSPQLCQAFPPMGGAQVRPATPPTLPMGQAVNYPGHLGGMVTSNQFYSAGQHQQFPGQQPQLVQLTVRPQGATAGGIPAAHHHHHHHPHQAMVGHQPPQHLPGGGGGAAQQLQHSQSFPILRAIPTSMPGPAPLGLVSTPAATTPNGQQQHSLVSVKSMSMGNMRLNGAATPDKDPVANLGMGGSASMMGGFGQPGTAMQFPGQFMTQGIRQTNTGEFRVMGSPAVRSQMSPLIAFQPGQPVRNPRSSGPRQTRPSRHSNSNAGYPAATTATASVARVMSLDSSSSLQQVINRP